MKTLTLIIIKDGARVLLGMKKRGFGAGKWNGFGGKVEAGETVEAAALRELREEAGITATLERRGSLRFHFGDDPIAHEVHVFYAESYDGEPIETEEMLPKWFALGEIPFHEMWPDDRHWLPLVLAGSSIDGRFWFEGEEIVKYRLETLAHA